MALIAIAVSGCTQGGLAPEGQEAERIFWVFWALIIAAGIVTLAVVGPWVWGSFRRPRSDLSDHQAEDAPDTKLERWFVVGGGIVMPAIVLAAFFGVQIASTMAQPEVGELLLRVTGHRYWWEVEYQSVPGVDPFETANQIHIPIDTQITMRLHSEDVIHSFWVPQLAGKLDLVPGRESEFTFSAEEPGVYAGYCAEFCGLQHAWMKFEVVAMEPDQFLLWAEEHTQPALEPESELAQLGKEVFLEQSCVGCHTIDGVAEIGEIGPDLTHLATRTEIGAGILKLNVNNLTAWIANPQAIKPGVKMPPQELAPDKIEALVAYLLSLE